MNAQQKTLMHVRKEDLRKSKNAAAQQLRQLARSYTPHGAEDGGRVINRLLGLEHFPDLSLDDREKDRVMQYLDEMSQASGIAPEIFDTLISRMKHGGALDLMDLSGASDLIESGMEYSLVRDMLGVVALVWWFKVGQDLPSTDGKPLPSI